MALDPKRPFDWEKYARECSKDRIRSLLEMFRLGRISGGTVINQPLTYVEATGGSSIIDVTPEDYKISDAPKGLTGVNDVDAPGSDKKT